MSMSHPWDAYLHHVFTYGNPVHVQALIRHRPDYVADAAGEDKRAGALERLAVGMSSGGGVKMMSKG